MKFIKQNHVPMPLHRVSAESNNYLVKYNLKPEMLMVSEDRSKFSRLSESTYQMCNSYHYQFWNPVATFNRTNINAFCVMALFIKTLCKQSIVLDHKLPIRKYLSFGIWIVITEEPLTLSLNCLSFKPREM